VEASKGGEPVKSLASARGEQSLPGKEVFIKRDAGLPDRESKGSSLRADFSKGAREEIRRTLLGCTKGREKHLWGKRGGEGSPTAPRTAKEPATGKKGTFPVHERNFGPRQSRQKKVR